MNALDRVSRWRTVAIGVNVAGLAVNSLGVAINLTFGNWPGVAAGSIAAALHAGVLFIIARQVQFDDLEIKKREADVASSEHAAVIMAKQREFVTREFVQAAAGERRH